MREGLLGSPRPEEELIKMTGGGSSRWGMFSIVSLAIAILMGSLYSITDRPIQSLGNSDDIHEWANIMNTAGCFVVNFYRPRSESEIIDIVKTSARMRQHVRVVGRGTSWAPLVCSEDRAVNMVSMEYFNDIIYVDQSSQTVTVQPGITLHDLQMALVYYQLSIPIRPATLDVTVGGCLSTGAHSSGASAHTLSHYLTEVNVIDARGRSYRASPEENSEIFYSSGLGVGVAGIISTVTLKLVPLQNVEVSIEAFSEVEEILSSLDEHLSGADEFSFFWVPSLESTIAISKRGTLSESTTSMMSKATHNIKQRFMSFALGIQAYLPRSVSRIFSSLPSPSNQHVYLASEVPDFHHPGLPTMAVEFFVPQSNALQAFRHLRSVLIRELNSPYPSVVMNGYVSVYFVKSDDFYLSPTYQTDSVAFEITFYSQTSIPTRFLNLVSESLKSFNARPHWSTNFGTNAYNQNYLRGIYPRFADFQSVRELLDPEDMFLNRYTKALLKDSVDYLNKKEREVDMEETVKRNEIEKKEKADRLRSREEVDKVSARYPPPPVRAGNNDRATIREEKDKKEKESKLALVEERSKQAAVHAEEREKEEKRIALEEHEKRVSEEEKQKDYEKRKVDTRESSNKVRLEERAKKKDRQAEEATKRQKMAEENTKNGEERSKAKEKLREKEEQQLKANERVAEENRKKQEEIEREEEEKLNLSKQQDANKNNRNKKGRNSGRVNARSRPRSSGNQQQKTKTVEEMREENKKKRELEAREEKSKNNPHNPPPPPPRRQPATPPPPNPQQPANPAVKRRGPTQTSRTPSRQVNSGDSRTTGTAQANTNANKNNNNKEEREKTDQRIQQARNREKREQRQKKQRKREMNKGL